MNAPLADAFVFFGATGDLAYKQIFPALQALIRRHHLQIPIIGVAKSGWSIEQLRERARDSLRQHGDLDEAALAKLITLLRYVDGYYRDEGTFTRLRRTLGDARRPLHYLAIPPSTFTEVTQGLARSGCAKDARIVVEKPFGRDLRSARELDAVLRCFFSETDIYRIDHFLGKEPVQNILYTRFANLLFEPIWNRTHIRSVQITLAENFGVQGRGRFYEETGAIRDVIQNHLLQVLACLAMDPPARGDPDAVRDERTRLLKAVRPLVTGGVVRGQYRGYRNEEGVAPDSRVETFAAVQLFIDSWRWADVPFYIRAGKRLPVTVNEVVVEFKRPPQEGFRERVAAGSNHVRLRLSPEVVVALGVRVKLPGEQMIGEDVELVAIDKCHDEMEPYERLLGDALQGEQSLFARQDALDAQWRIVDPVLGNATRVYEYPINAWGPGEADRLISGDGAWFNPRPGPPRSVIEEGA